jgi:hypothetical protein
MTDDRLLILIGALAILTGFWKAFRPMWWVDLRRRHPWYDKLDPYSFLYNDARAEKTVRISGFGLIVIGLVVFIAAFAHS